MLLLGCIEVETGLVLTRQGWLSTRSKAYFHRSLPASRLCWTNLLEPQVPQLASFRSRRILHSTPTGTRRCNCSSCSEETHDFVTIMRPAGHQTLVHRGRHDVVLIHQGVDFSQSYQVGRPPVSSILTSTGEAVTTEQDEDDSRLNKGQNVLQRYERSPSPRVYLDDSVLDRFAALPVDLPLEVVTEQLYNCKNLLIKGGASWGLTVCSHSTPMLHGDGHQPQPA
jgi:hypothetical protein